MAIRYSRNRSKSSSSYGSSSKTTSNVFTSTTNSGRGGKQSNSSGSDKYSYIVSDTGGYGNSKGDSSSSSLSFSLNIGGIVGPLFKLSMIFVFGSYLFSGAWDSHFVSTLEIVNTRDYLYESTNGQIDLPYDYNIKYVNYDWSHKMKQLEGLKNVLDIDLFNSYTNDVEFKISYLIEDSDYTLQDRLDLSIRQEGPLYDYLYSKYSYDDSIKFLIDNDYIKIGVYSYEDDILGNPVKSFSYLGITESYLNNSNISFNYQYILESYVKSNDDLNAYRLFLKNKNGFYIDDVLNVLIAPVTIVVNIFYDVGILLNFMVTW